MAALSKCGEAFDAKYVDNMMGKVLVQACAAVTVNKPHDPIEYLSLWLHKYCDNAITLQDYECEKIHKAHKEAKEREAIMKKIMIEQELKQQQTSILNYMRSITNDPYLLWDTCIRAITTYTGCQAAYIAVVVRKIFEPKPKKKKKVEGEEEEEEEIIEEFEEEEREDKETGSDTTSIDEEPFAADEEKSERNGEEVEAELELESEPKEREKDEGEEKKPPPLKSFRIPKPLNYKNKRILYVSVTLPTHIHMLNQEMILKSGPVTFSLLIEGLPNLHIPNVLYKEGIHYFGGCPRVGAYFVVPMSIEYIAKKYLVEEFKERPPEMFDIVKQKKIIALLCCDTLKSDSMGNGRPFQQIELDFIQDCANTMSSILNENNKEIKKDHNTPKIIQKFKDQLREIKLARVEQMVKEKEEASERKKSKEKLRRLKQFQEAHKAWEEHQVVKAKAKAKLERQKEKKNKKLEDINEEEELQVEEPEEGKSVEDGDPEPILEFDPQKEMPIEREEDLEESSLLKPKEGEESEEDKEPKDEFNDEELEPNPFVEIKEEEEEGNEGDGGEEVPMEELLEEEEYEEVEEHEEEEEEEPPPKETPQGIEEPKESEDAIKLKDRKKAHAKKEKETKKIIKELTKLLKGFEKQKKRIITTLEKLTIEVEKYERALFIANGVVQYLKKHMENAYNILVENKILELDRIRRWPYPNRHVQRILKALLHLLGHKKMVIDDWNSARKLFTNDLLDKVLKDYDPLVINDLKRWEDVDSYIMSLKDEKLHGQACIGFLLQQWILACKKTTTAGVNYHKIKIKYEKLSKDYTTLEMEKIMSEVEIQTSHIKLKKLIDDEEARIEKEIDEIKDEEKRLIDFAVKESI